MASESRSEWGSGRESAIAPFLMASDVGAIVFGLWVPTVLLGVAWHQRDWAAAVIASVLYLMVARSMRLYDKTRGLKLKRELVRGWMAWFMVVVPILLFLAFISKSSEDFSRAVMTTWFFLTPLLIGVWRTGVTLVLRAFRERGYNTRNVAVVGLTPLGEQLARQMRDVASLGLRLQGFFDDRKEERCHPIPPELGTRIGDLDGIVEAARAGEVDLVYIALPLRAEPRINELLRRLADTTATVYMAADFFSFDLLHAAWGSVGSVPVVSIHETPFYGVDGWLKRLEDLIVGTAILIVIALPMVVIGIGVKLTSPGPTLFRQRRYGLNGEVIDVLKFRSMTVSEDGEEIKQATKNDARVTKFGAFLRRTSLDELPQFLHVLAGTMSVVGPRPHAVAHNELYRKKIQGYMLRHKVKPGITGWAQVNGWRGETDTLEKMEKRVEHDLDYIRNWSLLWDLQIILMTMFGSRSRKNAY